MVVWNNNLWLDWNVPTMAGLVDSIILQPGRECMSSVWKDHLSLLACTLIMSPPELSIIFFSRRREQDSTLHHLPRHLKILVELSEVTRTPTPPPWPCHGCTYRVKSAEYVTGRVPGSDQWGVLLTCLLFCYFTSLHFMLGGMEVAAIIKSGSS